MSDKITIESSDLQRLELLLRVASLSTTLRNVRNSEDFQRRSQDGETVVFPVRVHGSILRKMVDLMNVYVDAPPRAVESFIAENRAVLFQLALASMELDVPAITQTLREAITAAIKGKTTEEIRQYFCIAETQSVVMSEEDDEGFELVASVIDRERSHKVAHIADRDSLVTACHFCKQEFSLTLRKHHCRKCFRVFCNNCANELVDMPDMERQRAEVLIGTSALTKVRNFIWVLTLKRNPLTAARLCSVCVFEQNQDVRVAGTTSVFLLCRFELPELMALRGVCQSWTWAAELCVTDITRMLAALPTHVFSTEERELLWANRRHFVGHNRWMTQLLRSIAWTDRARADEAEALLRVGCRQRDCKLLRCEPTCQANLTCSDAFELFSSCTPITCPKVRTLLVDALRTTDLDDMRSFLPGLVRALADEGCPRACALFQYLAELAARDTEFATQFYWALHVASLDAEHSIKYGVLRDLLLATLATTVGLSKVNELLAGMELVAIVRQCCNRDTLQQVRDELVTALARACVLSATQSVRLPVNPSFEAVGLSVEGIRRMESHVAPTVLPFLGTSSKHAPPSPPALSSSSSASAYGVAGDPPARHSSHLQQQGGAGVGSRQRQGSFTLSSTPPSTITPPSPSRGGSSGNTSGGGLGSGPSAAADGDGSAAPLKRAASFSTATAPTVAHNADSRVRTYQTLQVAFKKEDLRKDWIVQAIISYMHRCLARDGLDVPVLTYRVLPTSARDGLVEWVPDSMNLTEIEKSYHLNIQNYLVNNNGKVEVDQVRRTFMLSLAASTIMTFLLLVGDRHKENMMIHRSGTFFHIDYGYVLGEDPKPMLRLNLALKSEMIDALGGEGNPLYRDFRMYTTTVYNSLRKHASTIIAMMMLLLRSLPEIESSCDPALLEEELLIRFAVGRTDVEAEELLRHYMDGDLDAVLRGELHDRMHALPRNVQNVAVAVTEHVKSLAGAAAGLWGRAAETASRHLPALRLPSLYGAPVGTAVPDHPWLAHGGDDQHDDRDDADDDGDVVEEKENAVAHAVGSRTANAAQTAVDNDNDDDVHVDDSIARSDDDSATPPPPPSTSTLSRVAHPPDASSSSSSSFSPPSRAMQPATTYSPATTDSPAVTFTAATPFASAAPASSTHLLSTSSRAQPAGRAAPLPGVPLVPSPSPRLPATAAATATAVGGASARSGSGAPMSSLGSSLASMRDSALAQPSPSTLSPFSPFGPGYTTTTAQPAGHHHSSSPYGAAHMSTPAQSGSQPRLVSLPPPPPPPPTTQASSHGPYHTAHSGNALPMDFLFFDHPARPAPLSSTTAAHVAPLRPTTIATATTTATTAASPASSSMGGSSSFFPASPSRTANAAYKLTPVPAARPAGSHHMAPVSTSGAGLGWTADRGSPDLSDENFEDTQDSF